jgi:hypothetical protein
MNGVITICLKKEIYYHWSEVLFKSILLYTNVDFALVYDNQEWFNKYNLDKLVKYSIYKTDIENPYTFKYELIKHSPFDNTIFFDADTIIFKDITPLFNEQFLSICAEWENGWIYNEFSFIKNPDKVTKDFGLQKLYSAYSGFIRFEKTNFYFNLFQKILNNIHFDRKIARLYNMIMPDEYFLDISISDLDLNRFIPIKLYYSDYDDEITKYYGFTFQNCTDIKIGNLDSFILNTLKNININNYLLSILNSKINKEINIIDNQIVIKPIKKMMI